MGQDSEKIQELQALEQNLQTLSLQRQAFTFEISESEHALQELKNSQGDVYKIVGQVMVLKGRDELAQDLERKLKLLNLRMKAIESQEKELLEKSESLRDEFSRVK